MTGNAQIEPDRSKWDHTNPEPIEVVCSRCGSSEVTRDAVVRWSIAAQRWEVSGVFDNADCDDCGGETRLEDKELG